jgi:hypothetical protein
MKHLLFFFVLGFVFPTAQATENKVTAAAQKIDELLAADWAKEKLQGNAPASDEVLVRRLYLDIAGRIPTYRESEEFLGDKSPGKRAALIDKLLVSEGYVQHFFNFWADILRLQGQIQGGGLAGGSYFKFIKDSLRDNKPYDQLVRDLVAGTGKAWNSPSVGYYFRDRDMPLDNMAATVRIFLGTRIECAQCHNHPFDKWTQMQFFQMGAFSIGINAREDDWSKNMVEASKMINEKAKNSVLSIEDKNGLSSAFGYIRAPFILTSVVDDERRPLALPHDYQYPDAKPKQGVLPAVLYGKMEAAAPGIRRMESYANWMTSKDNERFTRVIANRLWKKVFGAGQFEPVDEIMDSTVATNPALMSYLEGLMKDLNFDMKAYLRVLFNTSAYQRSVSKEELLPGVPNHFTGPMLRRMTAEQMWDSFITLMIPTPDMPDYAARETQAKRLAGLKKLWDAVGTLTPEELFEGAQVAAKKYAETNARMNEAEKEIIAARGAGDLAKAKELTAKFEAIKATLGESRQIVQDLVFTKGIKRLESQQAALKSGGEAAPVPEAETMAMQTVMRGYETGSKGKKTELSENQKKQVLDEARYFGITDEKQVALYLKSREETMRRWLRAAEISSPAPVGHYLREFGQSDRELIENANNEASVPQALTLMNSELLPQILGPFSALTLSLNKMSYSDQKVEAAYVTLLSRRPTAAEKEMWQKAQDKGIGQIEDLIFALINTQQFIFVQ